MKKLSLLIVLSLILTMNTFSKGIISQPSKPIYQWDSRITPDRVPNIFINSNIEKDNSNNLQATYTKIGSGFADARWSFANDIIPIYYEPISGFTAIVEAGRTQGSAYINVWTSSDISKNSAVKKALFTSSNYSMPIWPSITMTNPKGTKVLNDLGIYVYSPMFRLNADQTMYELKAGEAYIWRWNNNKIDSTKVPSITKPGYKWYSGRLSSFYSSTDKASNIIVASNMFQPDNTKAIQAYATCFYSSPDNNGTTDIFSWVPAQIDNDNFYVSDPTKSYFNPIYTSMDAKGIAYLGCANFKDLSVSNMRQPFVTKSSADYMSFDNLNSMGDADIQQFLIDLGGADNQHIGMFPYESYGFRAYGDNKYSMLARFYYSDGATFANAVIGEMDFDGTSWSIRKVGDVDYTAPFALYNLTPQGETVLVDSLLEQPLADEVQLSITADGQYLVAKWVDFNPNRQIKFPANFKLSGGQAIDSLPASDVYMSYRRINESQWHTPINVTDDDTWNKNTWIPEIVPNLDFLPMVSLQTKVASISAQAEAQVWSTYPSLIKQMIQASGYPQDLCLTKVSLTGKGVDQPLQNFNFEIKSITPNPVEDHAVISFTQNIDANVSLELFNSMGQKITNILDNHFQNTGFHSMGINTGNLSAGAYYVKMTANGQTVTKLMNIVK
ncbi:MAG: T9SS type A sorting domain-containing protein [Candidatus Kapabacteria bacterium]|nr:T9SS type A sorting domain-containing protein [Candidatus Kapabacteria bacterium]